MSEQAGALFGHLYPDGVSDYLEIRTLPDKKQWFTEGVQQAIYALRGVSGISNVHFGLSPRRERSGRLSSCTELPAIFVDFDFKDYPLGQAEVEHKLDNLEHPPTATVESGHGIHAYWRIRNKPSLKDDRSVDLAKGTLAGFCAHVGGDPAASKITSCPRVPGFGNHKYQDVRPVEIASLDDATWYEYEDFTRFFVKDSRFEAPASQRPLGDLPSPPAAFFNDMARMKFLRGLWEGFKDHGDTSRSGLDMSLACQLRRWLKYSHEEIASCLLAYPHGKCHLMPRRYLQDTVNRAVSHVDSRG
jgi:hypothetical protein